MEGNDAGVIKSVPSDSVSPCQWKPALPIQLLHLNSLRRLRVVEEDELGEFATTCGSEALLTCSAFYNARVCVCVW